MSFFVAAPIVKRAQLEEVKPIQKPNGTVIGGAQSVTDRLEGPIRSIVFACDAGMGSSAMGATRFRKRIEPLGSGVHVTNSSVDSIPEGTDVVVCQSQLSQRAEKAAPDSEVIVIGNFLTDPALDGLYDRIAGLTRAAEMPEVQPENAPAATLSAGSTSGILTLQGIRIGLKPVGKEEAIRAAGALLAACGYVDEGYAEAMLARERVATTYLGMGIAIPHGTAEAKSCIRRSGIVVMQYPEGVDFGDEWAQLVIGIAGAGDEHIEILARVTSALEDEEVLQQLKTTGDPRYILEKLGN